MRPSVNFHSDLNVTTEMISEIFIHRSDFYINFKLLLNYFILYYFIE